MQHQSFLKRVHQAYPNFTFIVETPYDSTQKLWLVCFQHKHKPACKSRAIIEARQPLKTAVARFQFLDQYHQDCSPQRCQIH